MDEILIFLIKYCSDLYNEYKFKFVNSTTSDYFGDAALMLENNYLQVKFIKERGQLFLEFHSLYDKKGKNWYSFDLVRRLMKEEDKYYSVLDGDNGLFIQNNLEQILALFNQDVVEHTLMTLELLKKKRSKELFG